MFHKTAKPL